MRVSFEPRLPLRICLDRTHALFFLMCRQRGLLQLGTRECHLHSFPCVCQGPEGTHSPTRPCPPWALPPCPRPGTPFQPPGAISFCSSDATAGPVSAPHSPALGPAEPGPPAGPCPSPASAEGNTDLGISQGGIEAMVTHVSVFPSKWGEDDQSFWPVFCSWQFLESVRRGLPFGWWFLFRHRVVIMSEILCVPQGYLSQAHRCLTKQPLWFKNSCYSGGDASDAGHWKTSFWSPCPCSV